MATADPSKSKYKHQTVLITGCSTGIGEAIAVHLARCGHIVFAAMRRASTRKEADAMRETAAKEALALYTVDLDVDDASSCQSCIRECLRLAGAAGIDVLINNAGVGGKVAPIEETDIDDFKRIMKTNFLAPVMLSKMMLPYFRERSKGSVINITSIAARYWSANQGSYCASKAALEAFTCSLAQEVRRFGVQVSSLQPGVIVTPILFKEQATGIEGSPYNPHVRLSKKFYTAMMQSYGTQPIEVAKVVEQILVDADKGEQKPIYTAGPDADRLTIGLQRGDSVAWMSLEGSLVRGDQEHVDWFHDAFGLDLSPTFKGIRSPMGPKL